MKGVGKDKEPNRIKLILKKKSKGESLYKIQNILQSSAHKIHMELVWEEKTNQWNRLGHSATDPWN